MPFKDLRYVLFRRKHDFRRRISTFEWGILFEEHRIWTSGFNLRTRVSKPVTAARESLHMRNGSRAAKILPVGVRGTKTVWCLSSLLITAIRPGFETVSRQHAAHAQQRSYLIGAESLSSTTKLSKPKKGSTGRVGERQFGTKDFSLQK